MPCRLFVIMARDAPVAAVLRRGPSDWYQVLAWDTRHDTLTDGAWFKGRIYPEKCDLSPDGRLLVAFCHKGSRVGTDTTDSWTAVSRLPWLHALALWPQGTTYGGGGRFVGDRELVLRTHGPAHPAHPPTGLRVRPGPADLHGSTDEVPGAEWSGRDQAGELVFARDGLLFRDAGREPRVVADLNDRTPHPRPAPAWARRPLR